MRAFWVFLGVFVLAAIGFVVSGRLSSPPDSKPAESNTQTDGTTAATKAPATQASTPTEAVAVKMPHAEKPADPQANQPRPPAAPANFKDVVAQASSVSATLYVRDKAGKDVARGVGFLIASDLLVTSDALVKDAYAVEVHVGAVGTQSALGTIAEDAARGIAIVKLSQPVPQVQALRLGTSSPTTGQQIVVVARGTGPEPLSATGTLATTTEDPALGRVFTLATQGQSLAAGSAVLDSSGAVVGIVTEAAQKAKGADAAIAADALSSISRHAMNPFGMYAGIKSTETASAPTPAAAPIPAAEQAPGECKITKRDDGTMLIDDRYVVKGEGTKDKPYEITWEQLVSAQDVYDPRAGKKQLPGRVTILDGKYVRITGYIAFPLYVDQPTELLAMLNQWDGCCIGVPPTPYDAIEVKLTTPITKDQKSTAYGTVEGKLSVKPYLVGEWLVGLYLLDEGKLTSKQFGGFGS